MSHHLLTMHGFGVTSAANKKAEEASRLASNINIEEFPY